MNHCKNCGSPMDPNAAFCVNCGSAKGTGAAYCPNCGQTTAPGAAVCVNCGVSLTQRPVNNFKEERKMYCKNCGNLMDPNAAVCIKCGCAKGTGLSYCPNCGQTTVPGAAVCVNCGVQLTGSVNPDSKSKLVAGLLAIFLGSLGIHNFYLGYTGKAVTQLLITILGSCLIIGPLVSSVWALIEGIMIFTGKINVDAKGNGLKD